MTEADRKQRNANRLAELYPTFRVKIAAVLADLEGHGFRPRIQSAWRSPADQLAAYRSGHSKLRYGYHNVTGAGGHPEALAVDLLDDDRPTTESTRYVLMLAASAEAHGLTTGIRWGLPTVFRQRIDRVIAAKAWGDSVRRGWDDCHVETTGVSVAEAKAGERP